MSLESKWEEFREQHFEGSKPGVIESITRKAFYAGAEAATTRASDTGLLLEIEAFRSKHDPLANFPARPICSVCGERKPVRIYSGKFYCAEHHPDGAIQK